MSWTESGPVSTPPKATVSLVAVALAAVALFGVGYGVHAVWRGLGPAAAGSGDEARDSQAVAARPLVDIPAVEQPPVTTNAAPAAANAAAAKDQDEAAANTIAAKTAAAQAVQSKPADQPPDIDQMMTSPSEKPQTAAKPTTDEGAPGAPTNNVPF
ncbi:MAG TPA: hypothetical protein VGF50_00125 [Caulobacteraceae bacterium]|jgi:hypothetical protein